MNRTHLYKIVFYLYLIIGLLGLGWLNLSPVSAQTPTATPPPWPMPTPTPEPFFGFNTITHWIRGAADRNQTPTGLTNLPTTTPINNFYDLAQDIYGTNLDRWPIHWGEVIQSDGINETISLNQGRVHILDPLRTGALDVAKDKGLKVSIILNGGIPSHLLNVECADPAGLNLDNPDNFKACKDFTPKGKVEYCSKPEHNEEDVCVVAEFFQGLDQPPTSDENKWAYFIREVDRQIKQAGDDSAVAAWEIINEYDFIPYQGEALNALTQLEYINNFTKTLKVACAVLGNEKPVLLGGIEHVVAYKVVGGLSPQYRGILDAIRTDPELSCIDGISLHDYGDARNAADYVIENSNMFWNPALNNWPADKYFWITEAGLQHGTEMAFTQAQQKGCSDSNQPCGLESHQASYVIQHAVLTKNAFDRPEAPPQGKLFYYKYIDDAIKDQSDWGLFDIQGNAWAGGKAAAFVWPKLNGATMSPPEKCDSVGTSAYQNQEINNYKWIIFQPSDGTSTVHVLWNLSLPGSQDLEVSFTPCGGGSFERFDQEGSKQSEVWDDSIARTITLKATSHRGLSGRKPNGDSDGIPVPHPGGVIVGGPPVILIEEKEQSSINAASSIAMNNCQPVGTDLYASAPTALDYFTLSCQPPAAGPITLAGPQPAVPYLSSGITEFSPLSAFSPFTHGSQQPNSVSIPAITQVFHFFNTLLNPNIYIDRFPFVPPVNWTCTFEFHDFAGNTASTSVTNPGPQQCSAAGTSPGGDNPDDNYSDASALPASPWPGPGDASSSPRPLLSPPPLPPAAPSAQMITPPGGTRTEARVAILQRGYSSAMWQMVNKLGELATFVDADFDPLATAEKYPVLIIPSGGLYGLDKAVIFKKRLESYAEAGGTIMAFAQQHGRHYRVLPGDGVDGYGWQEDNSCFSAALFLDSYHPALAGFNQTYLTANVDGYFTVYPDDATILLSRTQNGLPGALTYPYGQGQVIVTSIYDDWGSAQGQFTNDTQNFLRNLLSWAIAQTDPPSYAPGASVTVPISITNTSRSRVATVRLDLISPNPDKPEPNRF
ncbi:MAG: hypothetical protein DPW09_43125 [Anaerolineae bacterium]|nr:hypothetical protein [Anaerolineales bacterium]MCQ3980255.1 hypothetical protein [Anaerolineae bacterium]